MKKARIVLLLSLLPVLALVVYVAYAETVICPVVGGACGAAQGTTVNADTISTHPAATGATNVTDQAGNDVIYLIANFANTVPCAVAGDCDGNDIIIGGPGGEVIGGANGANQANVVGNDKIFGNGGADDINGGPGNDYIDCGPGADNCNGWGDNDIIIGGQGTDIFTAGRNAGDDVFIVFFGDAGGAAEDLQCGAGTDVVIFVGFGNRIFTFPVPDAGAGTFTNTTADCEILIGG
jgi:Ca2+-binding RTX toxin-like protein